VLFAQRVDRAIRLLLTHDALHSPDVLALQEMDEVGVELIARSLGLNYVYYPAVVHPLHGRNFGNALLSPWRMVDDAKIPLPQRRRGDRALRIAVGATLLVGRRRMRAYSLHLGTPLEITPREREQQVLAVLDDARGFPGPVVLLGDMNARRIGRFFEDQGYVWATRDVRRTIGPFAWDHVFLRGPWPHPAVEAGVVRRTYGASDHKPVFAVLDVRGWPVRRRPR
jgi:endonuclease/exonuclease/phosphatase family metal-dependent hydrolase